MSQIKIISETSLVKLEKSVNRFLKSLESGGGKAEKLVNSFKFYNVGANFSLIIMYD